MKDSRNKKKTAALLLGAICLLIFLISSFMLFSYFHEAKKQEDAFRKLEQITVQDTEVKPPSTDIADSSENENIDAGAEAIAEYTALHEKNPDYWGWLKIDGTPLSYPVMHTPEDSEYYLRRDFDGNYSSRGVPFLDGACSNDCGNYIIYGHHMKDGTMFGSLLSYAKQDYYIAHPTIQLNTENGSDTYTVLAAFYSKAYNQEDTGVFRYYQYTDVRDSGVFDDYINQVKEAAIYDTGTAAKYGDQLLTLSTCSYHVTNGRFVVVAVRVLQSK